MPESPSASIPAIDADNPWPGLATFTEDQRAYFHGRDEEIIDLTQLAERRPLVVLFGQSGLGKSSILQAGVFPRLRTDGFCPIYIRLDHSEGAPPPAEQIKEMVRVETAKWGTWTKPGAAKPGESLWEFFHHRDDRLLDRDGLGVVPVLVFDQFEELFTLGAARSERRERAVAFIRELAELVENRPSAQLVARLEQSAEEMDAFDFSRTDYRVIISLREDFLPDLESLKTIMPALMQKRMRLTRLNGTQALDAVLKPGGALVTEEVARAIVEFVAGARGGSAERLAELVVEPALLSVICRELNERRRALGQTQITADLVSGNRREILTDFYERSVAGLPEDMRAFVEDHLLTKSGFRDNLALETALEFPGVTQPLLDTLVSRRLLRLEDRLGVQRVELTHDVLAEVIRVSRDTRQQREATEQLRQQERVTRRRMWLARTIAAGLLVGLTGVSWIAWRAIRAEREQAQLRTAAERLRAEADTQRVAAEAAREQADALRKKAESQELAARRVAYASDMNALQRALDIDNLGRARELLNRHRPKPGEVDLRGWEWRYFWQLCQSGAREVFRTPNGVRVTQVALSADLKWTAIRRSREVLLQHLETGEQVRVAAGKMPPRFAFSPRAPLLAIATAEHFEDAFRDRTLVATGSPRVMLWDLNTRQVVWEQSLPGYCNGLSFSQDGQSLVVGSGLARGPAGAVAVWRVADGTKVAGWAGGSFSPWAAKGWFAATPDATTAAVVRNGRRLSVVDLATGQERWSAIAVEPHSEISVLAFSPDGRVLATGGAYVETAIRLWDAVTGQPLGRLEGQRGYTTGLTFLADGKHLLSASADQTIRLWSLETKAPVRFFRGHRNEVHALALGADQRTFVSGDKDGAVYLWDLTAEPAAASSGRLKLGRNDWRFAEDSESLVTVSSRGQVSRRHGRMYQEESPLFELGPKDGTSAGSTARISSMTLSPTRPLLAAMVLQQGRPGWFLEVWDVAQRRRVMERKLDPAQQRVILPPYQFSPDGTKLYAVTATQADLPTFVPTDSGLVELEVASGQETRSIAFPGAPSNWIGPGTTMNDVRLLPLAEKSELLVVRNNDWHRWEITADRFTTLDLNVAAGSDSPAVSGDEKLLAVPSENAFVQIYETSHYQPIARLSGLMLAAHSAAFSSDGRRIAIAGTGYEALTVWDLQNQERLITLGTDMGVNRAVKISPDGNVIAIGNHSETHFWRAPSWAEIERAEAAEQARARP